MSTSPANALARHPPTWRERLHRAVLQDPLIESRPSQEALDRVWHVAPPRAVFFGLGLCTGSSVSAAMPADLLGVLLPAERIRRTIGARHLVVVVADEHAHENGFDEKQLERVARRAEEARQILQLARHRFRLQQLRVVRASEFHQTEEYTRVLEHVRRRAPAGEHAYFKKEVADIAYLERLFGGVLKVGWAISAGRGVLHRRDEVAFDRRFGEWMGRPVCSVYCKAGRTLDDKRPKASPYVALDPSRRICLDPKEDVRAKLQQAREQASPPVLRGVRRHLKALARAYGELVEPCAGPVEQRLQQVLSRLFAGDGTCS